MRRILQLVSWLSLAATLGVALAYFQDRLALDAMKRWMLVATIAWFVVTPMWMGRKPKEEGSRP
jgi:hypothetical protein